MIPTTETNKRYYWLKLKDDFFRQKEIKQLRKIAGGDSYTIIYLKMLLRSLKDNGKLYYEGVESDFVSELALDIDEDVENVKMTVAFLLAKGILIQSNESEYDLITANEMTGSECFSAERMRRLRGKKLIASQSDSDVTESDEEKREKKQDTKQARKRAKSDSPDGFEDFWKVYPRRVSKQTALKAWMKLKADETLTGKIVEDVRRRIEGEWRGRDVQYIPHPATYLNQRRWEDEGEQASEPVREWDDMTADEQREALDSGPFGRWST